MSATIGRDHIVDLVVGNRRPYTVHFNFVVVANDATLGRSTIHQIAARALAIVSFECRVEALTIYHGPPRGTLLALLRLQKKPRTPRCQA